MAADKTTKCECGCGEPVARRFKQGHDGRLKGQLLRDFRSGDAKARRAAMTKARRLGWERFMTEAGK